MHTKYEIYELIKGRLQFCILTFLIGSENWDTWSVTLVIFNVMKNTNS